MPMLRNRRFYMIGTATAAAAAIVAYLAKHPRLRKDLKTAGLSKRAVRLLRKHIKDDMIALKEQSEDEIDRHTPSVSASRRN